MSKKINISLSGSEITLNFGIGRFYNLFKDATGKDLLTYSEATGTTGLVEIVQGLVYAGYYAECKLNKTTPSLSKEEIFEAILDSDTSIITKIFEDYIKTVSQNGVVSGEAVSQLSA